MSLIRARKRRKSNWMDTRKGMPQKRLIAYLFTRPEARESAEPVS